MLSKPPSSHPSIPPTRRGISATLLTHIRNPSQLVRALYLSPSRAPHTLLSGAQVEHIASAHLDQVLVDPSYFWTEKRWREHRRGLGLPEEPLPYPPQKDEDGVQFDLESLPQGTVGAVALDANGCIASLTSTGGKTNKLVGRIGDTPLMGSGFWAEEWKVKGKFRRVWRKLHGKRSKQAVGVSGTGDGDVRSLIHSSYLRYHLPVYAVLHPLQHSFYGGCTHETPGQVTRCCICSCHRGAAR